MVAFPSSLSYQMPTRIRDNRIVASVSPYWGETLPGVKTRLATTQKVMALTFDACGSTNDGVDERIISTLNRYQIPATFFISGRWMAKYPAAFRELARNPLFEIENHGLNHQPASTRGYSAYGIAGTPNASALFIEVEENAQRIGQATSRRPTLYRSGTAFYDTEAITHLQRWGYQPVGFSILGDAGATYTRQQVKAALLNARPGDIAIMHVNHPEKDSGNGLSEALPVLLQQGWRFVQLQHAPLI